MKTIDKDVLNKYNMGIEKNRLHEGLGLIEFERTKEILREYLPPAPAVIYDIGGGYGEYAYWLTSLGYEVYLYDLSERNIEMARDMGIELGIKLRYAGVADAREIDRNDNSADAILLFGPLYHVVEKNERLLCLKECYRLLKEGGVLFTAAITRYATALWAVSAYDKTDIIDEDEFFNMVKTEVETGEHIKNPKSRYRGMGRSHFHLPDELKEEIESAGFSDTDIRGVVGPCWLAPNLNEVWANKMKRESLLRIVRLFEKEENIIGLSTHILSISRKEESNEQ